MQLSYWALRKDHRAFRRAQATHAEPDNQSNARNRDVWQSLRDSHHRRAMAFAPLVSAHFAYDVSHDCFACTSLINRFQRFLPSPSDGLRALGGRSPHLCTAHCAVLLRLGLCGCSLRLCGAHCAPHLTAQPLSGSAALLNLFLTRFWPRNNRPPQNAGVSITARGSVGSHSRRT
jgi:hypothetical protein